MKKILLLYISNNSGHHRATKAIEEALYLASNEVKVINLNCFNYTNPVLEKVINSIYNKVIKVKPEVWEYLYDNPKVVRRTQKLRKLIHKLNSKKLKKLIFNFQPDAVVCSQAFPCGMVADFKKTYDQKYSLIGVLTDYAPHSYWMYDNVDAYIVPSQQTKTRFVNNGIDKKKLFPFGIPISQKFSQKSNYKEALEILKLDEGIPTILIMGGGQGLGPIEDLVYAINTIEKQFQVIIVCGTNKKLKKWLEKRRLLFRKKMAILGYTKEVEMLMDVADLIVTKPGGLTTAEALTKNLPIVIVNPIPGQEAKNTEFLLKEGVAVKAKNPLDAAVQIEELLGNPEQLKRMKAAAKKHAQPNSAKNIAELVLKLIKQE
ncbi:MAG: glycosyltransferase [Candidatus Omnitrophota bacterium]